MKNNNGFTLVELMIALAMTGIIIAAVYSTYAIQKKSSAAQDRVSEMQQNTRAGIIALVQEIRMSGFDPLKKSNAAIKKAYKDAIYFTVDRDEDGTLAQPGENIAFDLYTNTAGVSVLGFTENNSSIPLNENPAGSGHYEATGHQPIAENIEALEFLYTLKNGSQTTTPTNSQLSAIRSITVSILARTSQRDAKYINSTNYFPASEMNQSTPVPWDLNGAAAGTAPNDNFRRRLLITTVQCRNMGL